MFRKNKLQTRHLVVTGNRMQANSSLFRYFHVDGSSYSSASVSFAGAGKGIIFVQLLYQLSIYLLLLKLLFYTA
jgi:hypothetical protein